MPEIARPNIIPARAGDWIQTFTGRRFWPLDPRPEDICVEDIAHALSLQCRYGGHCLSFYSVAEHSVLLANHVAAPFKRWALMHDASEAYLVDVPRPIKRDLANYREIEARVMAAVCERFGLPRDMPAEVHEADNRIIGDERRNLASCEAEWTNPPEPLGIALKLMSPLIAENAFIVAYDRLFS
ncbi:MAG: phosphohydrolase [Rhizobiaceae bacterium]|nr:phosphohydrolase [Rhizobiaceae bacterium]